MNEEQKKAAMIELADKIFHYKWIAKSVGLSEDTLKRWRDADQEFADRLEEGRTRFIQNNMRKAKPEFLLQSADRDVFGDKKKIDVSLGVNMVEQIIEETGLRDEIEAERRNNLEGESGRKGQKDIPVPSEG